MRTLLASDFGIWPANENVMAFSDNMLASKLHRAQLANYILLYDQIIIPTGNFQILPVLRIILGEDTLDYLIKSNVLVFARFDHWIGYGGSGAGLLILQVGGPEDGGMNFATAHFEPLDVAINTILTGTKPVSTAERKSELTNLLLDNVVVLPSTELLREAKDETYQDILNSPYLKSIFQLRNAGRSLNTLKGIGPNKITSFNPKVSSKDDVLEIRSILKVAFDNFLLSIGGYSRVSDIAGDKSSFDLLKAKGQRYGHSLAGADAFSKMQSIHNILDIGLAFANGLIKPDNIIAIRESKECIAMRSWFEKGCPNQDADCIVQRYIETIGKPSWIDNLQFKTLRFATTTGISVLEPVAGAIVSFVDSMYLSKWLTGPNPKLFMTRAKIFQEKHSPTRKSRKKSNKNARRKKY